LAEETSKTEEASWKHGKGWVLIWHVFLVVFGEIEQGMEQKEKERITRSPCPWQNTRKYG